MSKLEKDMEAFSKRKAEISSIALRIYSESDSNSDMIDKVTELLISIKTLYPSEYQLYLKEYGDEVTKTNVIPIIKKMIKMSTFISF